MNRILLWVFGLPFFILLLSFLHIFIGVGGDIASLFMLAILTPWGIVIGLHLVKIWLVPSIVLTFIVQLLIEKR
jgi:hypothetical protein